MTPGQLRRTRPCPRRHTESGKDDELLCTTSEALIYVAIFVAMSRLMLRHLARQL